MANNTSSVELGLQKLAQKETPCHPPQIKISSVFSLHVMVVQKPLCPKTSCLVGFHLYEICPGDSPKNLKSRLYLRSHYLVKYALCTCTLQHLCSSGAFPDSVPQCTISSSALGGAVTLERGACLTNVFYSCEDDS